MKERIGKVQRGVRRAFAAANGVPLRTRDLLLYAYPRLESYRHDQYRALYHAAPKFAVRLGKQGRAIIWGPSPSLLARIRGE